MISYRVLEARKQVPEVVDSGNSSIRTRKLTNDLKSDGDDEKAFEKALKETAVHYHNRLNKVVEDMSDVQRQEYKRSVNIAFSLVDPSFSFLTSKYW